MKPIIFSTPMVLAILEGKKSQTRRVIKPHIPGEEMWEMDDAHIPYVMDSFGPHYPTYAIREPGYDYRGMILWVRETWTEKGGHYFYKAGHELLIDGESFIKKWNSPRFMPKKAARLFLLIQKIWPERLKDISEEDAKAEGFNSVKEFLEFWDILNAKRGYGVKTNPWVFAHSFEQTEKPEGGMTA